LKPEACRPFKRSIPFESAGCPHSTIKWKWLPIRQYACSFHANLSVTRSNRWTKKRRSSSSMKIERPSTPRDVRW